MDSQIYNTKVKKLTGNNYNELYAKAKFIYNNIASKTKRRPYLRSKFFKKEKVSLDLFWVHLMDKNKDDRVRRLKQYNCGLDLIKKSFHSPIAKLNPNNHSEMLYRFIGLNGDHDIFYVQIKENIKSKEKSLMSTFPNH
ncbi:MAG: hypothetical protein Q7S72_00880 [Candidatus Taylorbacteria bacterium]|nr:hypothetical protein [Candidatus Taylorbacteria bacterium]